MKHLNSLLFAKLLAGGAVAFAVVVVGLIAREWFDTTEKTVMVNFVHVERNVITPMCIQMNIHQSSIRLTGTQQLRPRTECEQFPRFYLYNADKGSYQECVLTSERGHAQCEDYPFMRVRLD